MRASAHQTLLIAAGLAGGFALTGSLLFHQAAFAAPDVSALWSWSLASKEAVLAGADGAGVRTLVEPLALVRNLALLLLAAAGLLLALPRLIDTAFRPKAQAHRRDAQQIETARQQIDGALFNILNLFRSQIDRNQNFSAALGSGQTKLATPQSPEQIRAVIQLLLAENERMLSHNEEYERKLKESREQIASLRVTLSETVELSLRDSLTHLFTRRHFDTTLAREVRKSNKSPAPLSLVMADIDHFKRVNDTFGHPIGDEVLKKFAELMIANTKGGDCVARYGGEEFAIILPSTSAADANRLADQIRQKLESTKWLLRGGAPLGAVTASFGVAEHHSEESAEALVKRADAKLYQAKTSGRNRVCR